MSNIRNIRKERKIPLHPQEVFDLKQVNRLEDFEKLVKRRHPDMGTNLHLRSNPLAHMAFQTALNTILNWSEYDEGNQEVFNHSLLEFDLLTEPTLSISASERNHIVSIFNATGR